MTTIDMPSSVSFQQSPPLALKATLSEKWLSVRTAPPYYVHLWFPMFPLRWIPHFLLLSTPPLISMAKAKICIPNSCKNSMYMGAYIQTILMSCLHELKHITKNVFQQCHSLSHLFFMLSKTKIWPLNKSAYDFAFYRPVGSLVRATTWASINALNIVSNLGQMNPRSSSNLPKTLTFSFSKLLKTSFSYYRLS